ncbi:probable methyltransferase-like protein 25 [Procambarus clarkii]|uniref:probable methyltransferase-like protein 25 n=1 Tax=Procambarus clarkii TaxID=6728 RepID=UPI003742A421
MAAVQDHSLPSLGITTSLEEVLKIHGSDKIRTLKMKGIMSDKKAHEVEVMSQVIARLAKGCEVDSIVDLGSGRGYLSSSLVLQYGLNVVGIDSSKSNTSSAVIRNDKLQRHWEKLKQSEWNKMEGKATKKGKMRRKSGNSVHSSSSSDLVTLKSAETSAKCPYSDSGSCGKYIAITRFITDDANLVQIVQAVDDEVHAEKVSTQSAMLDVNKDGDGQFMQIIQDSTVQEHIQTDLELGENLEKMNLFTNSPNQDDSACGNTFIPDVKVPHLGLVGLHTCGNLASSSLRLFVSNSEVHFLCNVGCCYHLIEEEFSKNVFNHKKIECVDSTFKTLIEKDSEDLPNDIESSLLNGQCEYDCKLLREPYFKVFKPLNHIQDNTFGSTSLNEETVSCDPLHPSEIPNLSNGFPLSSTLKNVRFAIGRNSRMLSCQPADRLTQGNFSGTETLFWRALLQLLLRDKLGDVSDVAHVGRLASKCHNFSEYARLAISKLGVSLEVTQEDLEQYYRENEHNIPKLERFFLLRASLAPVVEGLILLDRLAYLREQENICAYLVQLFDPVTSPRCYGIIALRNLQYSIQVT